MNCPKCFSCDSVKAGLMNNKQRYYDSFSLYQLTDKLNYVFMKDGILTTKIRQLGFSLINNNKNINNKIVNYAMGVRSIFWKLLMENSFEK